MYTRISPIESQSQPRSVLANCHTVVTLFSSTVHRQPPICDSLPSADDVGRPRLSGTSGVPWAPALQPAGAMPDVFKPALFACASCGPFAKALLGVFVSALLASNAAAQCRIEGTVRGLDGAPIAGALVRVQGPDLPSPLTATSSGRRPILSETAPMIGSQKKLEAPTHSVIIMLSFVAR